MAVDRRSWELQAAKESRELALRLIEAVTAIAEGDATYLALLARWATTNQPTADPLQPESPPIEIEMRLAATGNQWQWRWLLARRWFEEPALFATPELARADGDTCLAALGIQLGLGIEFVAKWRE